MGMTAARPSSSATCLGSVSLTKLCGCRAARRGSKRIYIKHSLRPKTLRSLAVLTAASVALALGACGGPVGGGGQQEQEQEGQGQEQGGGSATSGTVNWWGWTPTDTATANGYIAAFNKEYPDIKVNFKLVSIPDWQAALPPALRSNSGPAVFDMQPGSYVQRYGSCAEDLTPLM